MKLIQSIIICIISVRVINSKLNCPNVTDMTIGQSSMFSWNMDCDFCRVLNYRKNPKGPFLFGVQCEKNTANSTKLNNEECNYENFVVNNRSRGAFKSTVCRVDKNEQLERHIIWKTFFSSQPTELRTGIETINAYQASEHRGNHHKRLKTGVSLTNWIILGVVYVVFGIVNLIQFTVNEDHAWY